MQIKTFSRLPNGTTQLTTQHVSGTSMLLRYRAAAVIHTAAFHYVLPMYEKVNQHSKLEIRDKASRRKEHAVKMQAIETESQCTEIET